MQEFMRIATRGGSRQGQCNICGEQALLTEDHVPPKGCFKPSQIELRTIHKRITGKDTAGVKKSRSSQNGVKFKTLCARCNNTLLGKRYDPELIRFSNQISDILRSGLFLPEFIEIAAKPQYLIRAVLGHLSAVGVDRYQKGDDTVAFSEYMIDLQRPLPASFRIYYWLYPGQNPVIVRDAGIMGMGEPFGFWLLKFFPVAFFVTRSAANIKLPQPVCSLEPWRDCGAEEVHNLPIRLHPIPHVLWPETPTDNTAVLFSDNAYEAEEIPPKPKLLNLKKLK